MFWSKCFYRLSTKVEACIGFHCLFECRRSPEIEKLAIKGNRLKPNYRSLSSSGTVTCLLLSYFKCVLIKPILPQAAQISIHFQSFDSTSRDTPPRGNPGVVDGKQEKSNNQQDSNPDPLNDKPCDLPLCYSHDLSCIIFLI